jgi:uncharacterized membrane protein YjjP (DUF1212 family)
MKETAEAKAIKIAKGLIENGAEISRAENTAERILKANGIKETNVFCTTSMIIISTENTVLTTRIKKSILNLSKIDDYNSQSRAICNKNSYKKVETSYSLIFRIFTAGLATSSFCLYFGGNIKDAIFSAIIGLTIFSSEPSDADIFSKTLLQSIFAGILAYIPTLFINGLNPDKIMIGTIMLLIPGITIGTAMQDIMKSDILSGLIEFTKAIFKAIAIALGYSVAIFIFEK